MPLRILTLCGMGFGTSMMLRLFVEDILKVEGIKAQVTATDLGSYKGTPTDIIVAPTDMERHLRGANAKVVLINNLIDKEEVKDKVLKAVEEFQNPPQEATSE